MKPLSFCKLRTVGLASVASAKFGMVRKNADGTPRAHAGIDLVAESGTNILAVDDSEVVGLNRADSGYGNTLTLKIKDDLYAFYAHLGSIYAHLGQRVKKGDVLGITGSTGNAKGMDTIKQGAHLHFEIRTQQTVTRGLAGRLDPLDFVELDA
jgi:murein DD-endopeptidase MepM/ murein hydrolase activator NlpD